MARNEISTLKISIDIDKATGKIIAMRQELGNTKREVLNTSSAMGNLSSATASAGQSATTAAVNFQTMSQGFLNLSTSMVQTLTSFSNLDRAQNRAKMAAIAVARAEDLLAAKKLRLDELTQKGLGNTQKAINLNKELATATADLVVKQEKQVIEQGAVNDVYMLFFANIANVGFSTMQTLVALLGQEKAARIGATMATKLHTYSTWENLRASRVMSVEKKILIGLEFREVASKNAVTMATRLSTIATKAQSVALHGLKIALGPIGLGFMAISAAMDLMMGKNSMILNFLYDITGGMIGLSSEIEKVTEAEQELDTVTGELSDTLGFKMPHSLADAVQQLEKYRKEVKDTAAAQREMNEEMEETQEIQKKTTNLKSSGSGSWSLLPQAFAEEAAYQDQGQGEFAQTVEDKRGSIQSSEVNTNAYANQGHGDFAESIKDQRGLSEKIKSEGVSAMSGFVGATAGPTRFDPNRELGKLGYTPEQISTMSTDEINQILKQEYIIPYLEKFTTDKDFFLEQYHRQQTMKSLEVFKPEEYRVHQLSEQAKLKQKEWLGQTKLTSLQKQRMKLETWRDPYGYGTTGVNIEGRIHDGRAIGIETAEKLKRIAYPDLPEYTMKDKPKDILNKMIGTMSGTFDVDDPLYQLLKSGKSDITEERLAILAKYGLDVGMGGGETEAILATYANTVSDSRRNLMKGRLEGSDLSEFGLQSGLSSLGQTSVEETKSLNKMVSTMNDGYARQLELYSAKGNVQLYKELGGGNIIEGMQQYVSLGGSDFFKYNAGTSDFAVGKGFEGVSATAAAQITTVSQRRAMAAAEAMGRATWYKEQAKDSAFQTGRENVRFWVERATGGQLTAEDNAAITSLQSSHDAQVKTEADRAFETGKKVNLLWLRRQTINNAKALGQSISNRLSQERQTASDFGSIIGISQSEALQILRDKSQGEQTLIDMLTYQQRLDAMSSGVIS